MIPSKSIKELGFWVSHLKRVFWLSFLISLFWLIVAHNLVCNAGFIRTQYQTQKVHRQILGLRNTYKRELAQYKRELAQHKHEIAHKTHNAQYKCEIAHKTQIALI